MTDLALILAAILLAVTGGEAFLKSILGAALHLHVPKMAIAGVPAFSSDCRQPSSSTRIPTLRVAPKAMMPAWANFRFAARAKNSRSLGLEPGLPAST